MIGLDRLCGAGAAPFPLPGSAPVAPGVHSPSGPAAAADTIERPAAHASEHPAAATPFRPGDGLPVLAAVALLAGGAVLAAPAAAAAAGTTEAALAAGSTLARSAGFVKNAGRAFGAAYHEAARQAAALDYGDARAVGTMLGAQAWTATAEVVRGAVAGAALAGGVEAAERLAHAAGRALEPGTPHAGGR